MSSIKTGGINLVQYNTWIRFITPALPILVVLIAWFGPWWVISVGSRSIKYTMQNHVEGDDLINMIWVWVSGIGALVVVASAAVTDLMCKKFAQTGAYLMVILPVWSVWDAMVEEDVAGASVGVGWGLWMVVTLAIATGIVTRFIPEDDDELVTPHVNADQR